MIRKQVLTPKDLETAADLIHEGISESLFKYSVFDREAFKEYVVENPDNLIVVREADKIVGVMLFMINHGLFMFGTPVAVEIAWNVSHSVANRAHHWFKLLDMFEDRAKKLGADYATISSYVERLDKIYPKRGWVNDYKTFTKDLR